MVQDEDTDVWDRDAPTAVRRWNRGNDMVLSFQGGKVMTLCLIVGFNPSWADELGLDVDVSCIIYPCLSPTACIC